MDSGKIYQGIESRTGFVKAKPLAHGFGLEKRTIVLDDTGSAIGSKRKSLETTKIDEKLPRVASLVSVTKISDSASSLNGDTT